MAYSLTQFQNSTDNNLSDLDNDISTLAVLAPIPCTISGTNALVLTMTVANNNFPTGVTGYANYMLFTGVASGSNSTGVTMQVGSLPALSVYKDITTGPVVLIGGEIVAGNAVSFLYDAALGGGAGGFHLIASTATTRSALDVLSLRIGNNFTSTLTNMLSGTVALTFTATPGWSSQDQAFTLTGLPPALPFTGDFILVNPPSLAAAGVSYQGMVSGFGSLSSVASVSTVNIRLVNSASASLASNSGIYHWSAVRTTP